jgi:hypothetical protein
MRAAELRLSPETGAFPGVDAAIASIPGVTREALVNLEWLEDGSYALLYRLGGGDPAAVERVLADSDEVRSFDVVPTSDDRTFAFTHVGEREALSELLAIAEANALILDPPFPFTDDGVVVSVVGDGEALQAAFAEITATIPVTVEWTGGYEPGSAGVLARLTDRQREALTAAYDLGFYETPRAASYADIAEVLDCAPSTANELLRRAEATVVAGLLD